MIKRKYDVTNGSVVEHLDYDFRILSNSITRPKAEFIDPEIESKRSKLVKNLHVGYDTKCKELFYFKFTPKDSLNRLLLEQLSLPRSDLIKKPKNVVDLNTIDKEIKTSFCLTCKLDQKLNRVKLKHLINQIIHFAKQTLDQDYFRLIRENNLSELLKLDSTTSDDDFLKLFIRKRSFYQDLLKNDLNSKISHLKQFLYGKLSILKEDLKKLENSKTNEINKVNIKIENECVYIYYKDFDFKINLFHYKKLKDLYVHDEYFNESLFVLICRYQTYFRVNEQINEGYGMQAALPKQVFEFLNKNFGVSHEIFASPLNCYFRNYNSAFYDIDSLFCSSGSFFDFEPIEGSFEANPPFTEEVIERMADRIEKLLSNSKRALSFIIFIPEWLDPPTPGLVKMEKSKFLIRYFNADKDAHTYITGSQYVQTDSAECLLYKAAHNTRVFILQNEEGSKKWKVNDEKIQNLQNLMMIS